MDDPRDRGIGNGTASVEIRNRAASVTPQAGRYVIGLRLLWPESDAAHAAIEIPSLKDMAQDPDGFFHRNSWRHSIMGHGRPAADYRRKSRGATAAFPLDGRKGRPASRRISEVLKGRTRPEKASREAGHMAFLTPSSPAIEAAVAIRTS